LWLDQPVDTLPLAAWRVSIANIMRADDALVLDDNPVILENDRITFVGTPHDIVHAGQALNGEV
jgi:Trk K+ transport system NAD-binding subunit